MKRILQYVLFLPTLILIALSTNLHASTQKKRNDPLKEIEKCIKNNQANDALAKITDAENHADSLQIKLHELYWLGIEAAEITNKAENEKAYLKQAYDTTSFFNSVKTIFDYGSKCKQSLYNISNTKEKNKWQQKIEQKLAKYYINIGIGAKYFYRKKQYQNAIYYINYYLNAANNGLIEDVPQECLSEYPYFAFLGMQCNYLIKQYNNVFTYKERAAKDTLHADIINEILARSSKAINDTTQYYRYLMQGLRLYPSNKYYYNNISKDLISQNRAAELNAMSDSLLRIRPQNKHYLYGKSLALIDLKKYEEAIDCAKQIISIDTTATESLFHIGFCYYKLAEEIKRPSNLHSANQSKSVQSIKNYYRESLPYLEMYRKSQPNATQKWAPLLYQIYLQLNMGKQFEEISKIMTP